MLYLYMFNFYLLIFYLSVMNIHVPLLLVFMQTEPHQDKAISYKINHKCNNDLRKLANKIGLFSLVWTMNNCRLSSEICFPVKYKRQKEGYLRYKVIVEHV